ncbi:hypothetical protein [Gloeothece verrucosa]|uniref:Uncharacterized protein n=1 Tax=Gloeothece verrucosa (strain PCC 7822) TaxID=497965 RepID=E0ULX3_GLOV7|nr:hypothetical protein [Gloeothece verrucosa]ADN17953.1 hypothetical protein Cyan7822_6119 [Gloeothece verrucosa PCC 7822]
MDFYPFTQHDDELALVLSLVKTLNKAINYDVLQSSGSVEAYLETVQEIESRLDHAIESIKRDKRVYWSKQSQENN